MIVKTDGYTREQVGRVVQVRANVEGIKLGEGVLDRMAAEGERGSLRYAHFPIYIYLISNVGLRN
jgi:RuvB-like protein 1